MNKSFLLLLSFAVFSFNTQKAEMHGNLIRQETIFPGFIQSSNASWFNDIQSYVNGGVTFNFQSDLFVENPYIHVELVTSNYSDEVVYTPIITSMSTTSVTIRVNACAATTLGNVIAEAPTNSVQVLVWATGKAE
ncbi:hypothetical protein IPH25_05055 [bacterium]|nr:MAG: hypothetical protein IPG37_02055 [bacterium]QQR61807.1 MAG: hypothetical protein IPH25_05055 [bacterium]QQR62612.1 MAG: hypothetical protein IPH67_04315 [bacterium]